MNTHWRWLAGFLLCALCSRLWAGGSGLNVVVVVNQNSTNSLQLGNYYCAKRQVPPQNVLRVSWAGGNIAWQKSDFQSVILNPLLAMLAARQFTNQIDYVLLSMDFPYRVTETNGANSTTSALFYDFIPDGAPPGVGLPNSCSLPNASYSSYAGSEYPFRSHALGKYPTNFLAGILTSASLAQAKLVIDRAVACDGTFPTQTVYLGKSDDPARNIRYVEFDNTIFNARVQGNHSMQRTNVNWSNYLGETAGYENGYANTIPTTNYVPGALADQLTSFGGMIFESLGQTTALDFLNAGVAGSSGTVIEPCAYLEKFPSSQIFFYQERGFTVAECFYQSVTNPYQTVLVGEPLAAPFALSPGGSWSGLPANALLAGVTNLSLQLNGADANHPVQQVDLFVDGTFAQTLTNLPPRANNTVSVTIRGQPMAYTVLANATLPSVVAGLSAVLNTTANTNVTKVRAFPHGDRIELQSIDLARSGALIPITAGSAVGTATALTTFVTPSRASFLDSVASGLRTFTAYYAPSSGSYLLLTVTKTNGTVVTVGATNSAGNTSISALTQTLVNLINGTPALQGSDGLAAEDFAGFDSNVPPAARFNVRAISPGWSAAQIQARLSGSSPLIFQPATTQKLDQNVTDLQPRNHLYLSAGLTNLPLAFSFNTTTQADGYHELTVVVYEGTHVRTQKRLTQTVRLQNTGLAAAFTTPLGDTNVALEAVLEFSVVANTNTIDSIELFSTGGSLGNVLGQSNALFSVSGTNLGLGLHPFYAVVTAAGGKQYRTETKWLQLVGPDAPFPLSIAAPPPRLTWPATAGRTYDILSSTNLAAGFQPGATLTPSNSAAQWLDTNAAEPLRFYRVRTAN